MLERESARGKVYSGGGGVTIVSDVGLPMFHFFTLQKISGT
jgi:hypothetical protein